HFDRMCVGKAGRAVCGDSWRRLLDCGGDDYFNPGRSLVGRNGKPYWNTADSVFLTSERPAWWSSRETSSTGQSKTKGTKRSQKADGSTPKTHGGTTAHTERQFADSVGHIFEAEITALTESGITRGCSPDRYCPDQPLTRGDSRDTRGDAPELTKPEQRVPRAEEAALLVRGVATAPSKTPFADTVGHIFEADIASLADAGITRGCTPDRYCPDQPVTRGQMAARSEERRVGQECRSRWTPTQGHNYAADAASSADAGTNRRWTPDRYCPDRAVPAR